MPLVSGETRDADRELNKSRYQFDYEIVVFHLSTGFDTVTMMQCFSIEKFLKWMHLVDSNEYTASTTNVSPP